MDKEKKKNIRNILILIGLTVLILYFVMRDNFSSIMYQLGQANILWIIVATLLFYFSLYLKSLAFAGITHEFAPKYPLFEIIRLQLATQFFNGITPLATGAHPIVALWLNKKGVDGPSSLNIVVQDFITYQIALIILGLYAITFNFVFHMFPANSILKHLVTIGFIVNFLVIILLYAISLNPKFNKIVTNLFVKILSKIKLVKDKDKTIAKWEEYIDNFSIGAETLLHKKNLFIKTILLNILSLIVQFSIPLIISYSLSVTSLSLNESIISNIYLMLIGAFIPIPVEYTFLQFFGNFIKNYAVLSAVLILWRSVTYYFVLIVSSFAIYVKRDNK